MPQTTQVYAGRRHACSAEQCGTPTTSSCSDRGCMPSMPPNTCRPGRTHACRPCVCVAGRNTPNTAPRGRRCAGRLSMLPHACMHACCEGALRSTRTAARAQPILEGAAAWHGMAMGCCKAQLTDVNSVTAMASMSADTPASPTTATCKEPASQHAAVIAIHPRTPRSLTHTRALGREHMAR